MSARCDNAREYWRMLKGKNVAAVKPKITDEQYYAYFKDLS